jgi:hypothetical protein
VIRLRRIVSIIQYFLIRAGKEQYGGKRISSAVFARVSASSAWEMASNEDAGDTFCRASRAEQCRLSGVDRPTCAHCEVFAC